ncbi:MAG: hypothetical protein OHK0017_01170 [Patescibacteria group bacterium]
MLDLKKPSSKNRSVVGKKNASLLQEMLKEFELAYNLGPQLTEKQKQKLIKKFTEVFSFAETDFKKISVQLALKV